MLTPRLLQPLLLPAALRLLRRTVAVRLSAAEQDRWRPTQSRHTEAAGATHP